MDKPDDPRDDRYGWYKGFTVWHSYGKPEYYSYVNNVRTSADNYKALMGKMDLRISRLKGEERWKR